MNNHDKVASTTFESRRLARERITTDGMGTKSPRFRQLLDLAEEGNAEAVGDLWREFGFSFRSACGLTGNDGDVRIGGRGVSL